MGKNAMQRLNDLIEQKNSRICAGFDPTWESIPICLKREYHCEEQSFMQAQNGEEVIYQYGIKYINAIYDVVPVIKFNIAFFEQYGLENVYTRLAYEAKKLGLFVIGDVKRADIGSTSMAYANAFLYKDSSFDAITINPYFGTDGVMPFLKLAKENNKGVFILVKTSNKSSAEIQDLKLEDGRCVYEAVADLVVKWGEEVDPVNEKNVDYNMVGAVVGATHPKQAEKLTNQMDRTFCLVPGYGAQGATAVDVAVNFDFYGLGAIVNSSRGIMQAYKKDCWKNEYSEETWAEAARDEAIRATDEINQAIKSLN